MTSTKVLGLAGHAGAGKDYVMGYIYDLFDPWGRPEERKADYVGPHKDVVRIAFADEVRQEVQDVLNYGDLMDPLWNKPYPDEIRALLQWWGTDLRRAQDPDYWVKKGVETAKHEMEYPTFDPLILVFTDVRFQNEADAIRDLGGMVVEVWADDETRRERLGDTLPPTHASEDIDFETDAVIVNVSTPVFPKEVLDYLGLSLSGE